MSSERTDPVTVLLLWDGPQQREGENVGVQRQHGDEWSREKGTVQAGPPGMRSGMQPQTDPNGGLMFLPCAPPGAERLKVR